MIVNKNSWHYKVYDFSYAFSGVTPVHTNLCQYMRRIILVGPFMGILLACLFVLATVMTTIGIMFMPIFGYLPSNWRKPFNIFEHNGTYKYQGLKLGNSYNAFQVYPWHVVLLGLVVGLEWVVYHFFGYHPLAVEAGVLGIILTIVGVAIAIAMYFESATGKIINEYLAAKKQKVCPVVEFTNEETKQ